MKTKMKVLFLSANSPASGRLGIDRDWREMNEAIRSGLDRDRFEIATELAVRTRDLQRALRRHQPQFVHFSGHANEEGIELEDESSLPVKVSGEALAGLFRILRGTIRCVVLSACSSRSIALAFRELIDDTIVMRRPIADRSAILFGSAFYGALADGESVPCAFAYGVNQLKISDAAEEADIPELLRRKGLEADCLPIARTEPEQLPIRNEPNGRYQVGIFTKIVGNGNQVTSGNVYEKKR
jgi:hypothetical protein